MSGHGRRWYTLPTVIPGGLSKGTGLLGQKKRQRYALALRRNLRVLIDRTLPLFIRGALLALVIQPRQVFAGNRIVQLLRRTVRGLRVPAPMRIGIYARVSTKDQSCEMQLRDLRAYCGARSFSVVTEYVDVGQSGAKDSRPELNRLMDDTRKHKLDAVLVWRFDRFARSTKHLLTALDEFRSAGIQFISYQENMDTGSPLGQALFTIVAAVAQLERDLIRERVTAGLRNARAAGKQLGRPTRIIDRDEILRLRATGASVREIAAKVGIGYGTVRKRLAQVS